MADTRISRRRFGAWVAGAACAAPLATWAQGTYPQAGRPIRALCP